MSHVLGRKDRRDLRQLSSCGTEGTQHGVPKRNKGSPIFRQALV